MNIKNFIKLTLSITCNPKGFFQALKNFSSQDVYTNKQHIKDAAQWLLSSQNAHDDGGYSRHYSLYSKKWDKSYIETTGYIIPTLHDVGRFLDDSKYLESSKRAAEWLLHKQNSDGSFSDIDQNIPQVFDTGQCLIGLNEMFEKTNQKKYFEAARKASEWLLKNQEEDGSWIKHSYNYQPHSYYTRVASALIHFSKISKEDKYLFSGLKNIDWTIKNQKENGFFKYSSFSKNEYPVLHTIIYILEGLLSSYKLTKRYYIFESALKLAEKLKDINLQKDIILYSKYDETLKAQDKSKCITGLAQWAGVCLDIYSINDDKNYLRLAKRTIYYLKSKQIKCEDESMFGGFFGSIPFYGDYGSCKILNWNNKFFLDSMIKYDDYNFSLNDEHIEWVRASFEFSQEGTVNDAIDRHDESYLQKIFQILDNLDNRSYKEKFYVLDLGCGKGKYIDLLSKKYPNLNFLGLDPVYYNNTNISKGTTSMIPLDDKSIDVVLCIEVLQHERSLEESFAEIKRILKDNGHLFIGDRNKISILGMLKNSYEYLGMWMYPPDGPFKEKWYTKKEWEHNLIKNNFKIMDMNTFTPAISKIPFMNRYFSISANKIYHE